MKQKIKRHSWRFLNSLIFGLFFVCIIVFMQGLYYKYSPITTFIDFQSFDLQDYHTTDTRQIVIVYRDNKITTTGNFKFKTFCNGVSDNNWSEEANGIILNKTNGLERIVINSPLDNKLPIGDCKMYIHIELDIRGYDRYINLTDTFKVLK